jgi:hypothetical protein
MGGEEDFRDARNLQEIRRSGEAVAPDLLISCE